MRYPKVERPTEPGPYWYRKRVDSAWFICDVYHFPYRRLVVGDGAEPLTKRNFPGEWRGPIPQPEE